MKKKEERIDHVLERSAKKRIWNASSEFRGHANRRASRVVFYSKF